MNALTREQIKTLIEDCGGLPTMIPTEFSIDDEYQLGGYFKENAAFVIPVMLRRLEGMVPVYFNLPSHLEYWHEALNYIEGQTEVIDSNSRDSDGWQTVLRFKESPIELLSDHV